MILFMILFFQNALAIENPSLIYKNNSAVSMFAKEKFLESKTLLENEVVNNPSVGALHYNLGFIHENAKEPEKAIKEYVSAARTADEPNLKFQANFNAARVYGEQKDIPNALKYYQAALELAPDSKEVKTNIEMLFQGNGGGGGDSKDDKQDEQKKDEQKDGKDQKEQNQPPQNPGQQKKPAPKPFDSKDLSEQDVRKILDELKRQEEQIRAKINNEKIKETPVEKDW